MNKNKFKSLDIFNNKLKKNLEKDNKNENIYIKTNDSKIFKINKNYAYISILIKNICKLDYTSGKKNNEIYFNKINSKIMKIIINYMNFKKGNEYNINISNFNKNEYNNMKNNIPKIEFNYIRNMYNKNFKNDFDFFQNFMIIIDYLYINDLIEILCFYNFNIIKNMNYQEIFKIFY